MSKLPQGIAGSPAVNPAAGQAGADDLSQEDRPPQTSDSPKLKRAKGINVVGMVTGALLVSGGGAILAYSKFGPESNLNKPFFYGSFAPIGLGTLFIIGSIINPTE